jgi:hypothetical protein
MIERAYGRRVGLLCTKIIVVYGYGTNSPLQMATISADAVGWMASSDWDLF